jgi:hypothetical protein
MEVLPDGSVEPAEAVSVSPVPRPLPVQDVNVAGTASCLGERGLRAVGGDELSSTDTTDADTVRRL